MQRYLHKVYARNDLTVYNYMPESDFEGDYPANSTTGGKHWDNFYTASGTGAVLLRDKTTAPDQEDGTAVVFDGVRTRGMFDQVLTPTVRVGFSGWFHKDDWNTLRREALYSVDHKSGASQGGYGLHINYTSGYVSAIAYINSAWRETKYLLSSMTAGWNHIAVATDVTGQYLRLYVNGTLRDTYDHGSASSVTYGSGTGLAGLGCQMQASGEPDGNLFQGKIDEFTTYSLFQDFPAAEIAYLYLTKCNNDRNGAGDTRSEKYFTFENPEAPGLDTMNGIMPLRFTHETFGSGIGKYHCMRVITDTGGASEQGMATENAISVDANGEYTFSAYIKCTANEVVKLQAVPDVGSTLEQSFTATGAWQRIFFTGTFGASATEATIKVMLTNANASVKYLFIDKLMMSDGGTLYDYFSRFTENTPDRTVFYNTATDLTSANIVNLEYVKTLNPDEVVSDYSEVLEINGGNSDYTLKLARSAPDFGERDDIDFGNIVEVWHFDDLNYINGHRVYSGEIIDYSTTEGKGSGVTVYTRNLGAQMYQYIAEIGDKYFVDLQTYSGAMTTVSVGVQPNNVEISITIPDGVYEIEELYILAAAYDSSYIGVTHLMNFRIVELDSHQSAPFGMLTNGYFTYTSTNLDWLKITLPEVLKVSPGVTLYLEPEVAYSGQSLALKIARTSDLNGLVRVRETADSVLLGNNAYFDVSHLYCIRIKAPSGNTIANYLSYDPVTIVDEAIADFNRQGGLVSASDDSLTLSGDVVSYDFNTAKTAEVIDKCLELSPPGYYYFIDQGENVLYFRHRDEADTHTLILGVHLAERITFEKESKDMINVIYFAGGIANGETTNLFKKYVDSDSVELYGRRLHVYTDNRVRREDTADIIAQNLLLTRSYPTIRTEPFFVPSSVYDTWSIKPGDKTRFKNVRNEAASLFDVSEWDNAYFDFDIANPETFQFQIARIERSADGVWLTLSTVPPHVNRRIEDIKRNLDKVLTVDNPEVPS